MQALHGGGLSAITENIPVREREHPDDLWSEFRNASDRKSLFRLYSDLGPTNYYLKPGGNGDQSRIFVLDDNTTPPTISTRNLEDIGEAKFYGRIITEVPEPEQLPDPGLLAALGTAMSKGDDPEGIISSIPAGYTYLGQFIAHDLSRLWISRNNQPLNRRSAALDLDSVFGNPDTQKPPSPSSTQNIGGVRIGAVHEIDPVHPRLNDLPRTDEGEPVVPDSRNDAHVALSQTHVAIIKFYHVLCKNFQSKPKCLLKKWTIQCFQHVVLYDFLKRIIDKNTYDDVLNNKRRIVVHPEPISNGDYFDLPIEFAAACFRFGHSMVRDSYPDWNPCQSNANVRAFLGSSFAGQDLSNGRLRSTWVNDWLRLLDFSKTSLACEQKRHPLMAAVVDTRLASDLASIDIRHLPITGEDGRWLVRNLASRTLVRGHMLRLASGQELVLHANELLTSANLPPLEELSPDEIIQDENNFVKRCFRENQNQLLFDTPLWFYILKEASVFTQKSGKGTKVCGKQSDNGTKLGPLGSRIVMETLHAAIEASLHSILVDKDYVKEMQFDEFEFPQFIAWSLSEGLPTFPCSYQ